MTEKDYEFYRMNFIKTICRFLIIQVVQASISVNSVVIRKKKATASLMEYESDNKDDGIVGRNSIVTDFDGTPQCVIQTTEVRHLPFSEVDVEFAFDEGQGNQTLEYLRKVTHKIFHRMLR